MAAFDVRFLPIFFFGLVGGFAAFVIGVPMPFMLGGILGSAGFVLWYERTDKKLPKLSRWVRLVSMSVIGAMIGSRFSPELLTLLPQFWISGLALIPFILLAHAGNYAIMRKLGGYEKLDAYFAALPGGIIDSAALAEEAGADLRVVTTQHFIRIILVVTSVPLLLALALSVGGVIEIDIPPWLGHVAQFTVGSALGAQFSGVSRRLLVRGLGMGVLAGGYMLLLAATFALVLVQFVPADFGAMFISFAAGGLAEMSLIALSLNFNPVVVALHHLVRILLTVYVGSFLSRHVFKLV